MGRCWSASRARCAGARELDQLIEPHAQPLDVPAPQEQVKSTTRPSLQNLMDDVHGAVGFAAA
eukprot:scaffold23199_cov69-Phaeocystis_antarctica.AAC.2